MGTGVLDSSDGQEYYQWGRVFIKNCSGVLLQSVIFEFPTDTSDTTKYRNSVFYGFSGTFSIYTNLIGN